MDTSTLKLVFALLLLPIILGSFVYIDCKVMINVDWWRGYYERLFNPWYMIYYALIAPAGIYWSQKIIFDNSKGSVWAVSIAAAALLQGSGLVATYLASGHLPTIRESSALVIIAVVVFWSRG